MSFGKCLVSFLVLIITIFLTFVIDSLKQYYHYPFRYIHESRLVDSVGRVHVMTQMQSSGEGEGGTALSLLSIDNVQLADRGNYTCRPASGGQASISLHVLEGNSHAKLYPVIFFNIFKCPNFSFLKKERCLQKLFLSFTLVKSSFLDYGGLYIFSL